MASLMVNGAALDRIIELEDEVERLRDEVQMWREQYTALVKKLASMERKDRFAVDL